MSRAANADREVATFADPGALARATAERLVAAASEAVARSGRFTIALAGGSTPLPVYALLGGELRDRVPWERGELFFGDERCVPPDDPASNFGAVRRAFLVHVPRATVHRILGEQRPAAAADGYHETLRAAFPDGSGTTFDVALLGVGADGHTASLFPGSDALNERLRRAVVVPAPTSARPSVPRVTVTLPMFERAREVWFLCAGADKRDVVRRVLGGDAPELPAARVHGALRTVWLLDRAAAGGD